MGHNLEQLQRSIEKYYHRNKGVLDTLSKLQISVAKTQRCVIKTATQCGCTELYIKKQPPDIMGEAESMLKGDICNGCRECLEQCLGDVLFYFISLALLTETDVNQLIENQVKQLELLGKFNLK